MTPSRRPSRRIVTTLAASVAVATALATPAFALPADQFGVYPTWSTGGASGAFTASAAFAPSAGFPSLSVTTDSTTIRAPSGETAWLGDSTAFGQEFGSSRAQPYLSLATAAGRTNSMTTLTFGGPPPAGWGFALGDVDADWVFIRAWQDAARTIPLSVEQLGFQGAGNYCNNTPRPTACTGGPFTDAPVWVTAAETFDGIDYVPGTLRGNSLPGAPSPTRDTAGAYGWFRPTMPVASMDLLFGPRDGLPNFQLWLAAPAPKAVISGTVELAGQPPGSPIPAGTTATLNDAAGTPVPGIDDQPVTTPVAPDGTYSFETEQRDAYQITVTPPAGYTPPPPVTVAALVAAVTAAPIVIVAIAPAPTTTTTPASTLRPMLPATGGEVAVPAAIATALIAAGLALRRARRNWA